VDLSCVGVLGLALCITALAFDCSAIAVVSWAIVERGVDTDINLGLFKLCLSANRCERYTDGDLKGVANNLALVSRTRAATAMMILAVVCALATLTYCAFSLGRKGSVENGKISMYDSVVRKGAYSQMAAAIVKLIAVSIFADIINSLNHDDQSNNAGRDLKPGGAFSMACIGMFLSGFSAAALYHDSLSITYATRESVLLGGRGMI